MSGATELSLEPLDLHAVQRLLAASLRVGGTLSVPVPAAPERAGARAGLHGPHGSGVCEGPHRPPGGWVPAPTAPTCRSRDPHGRALTRSLPQIPPTQQQQGLRR